MFHKTTLTAFVISAIGAGFLLPDQANCAEVSWTTSLNVRETWDSNPSISGSRQSKSVDGAVDGSTEGTTANATTDTSVDTKKTDVKSDFVTYVSPQISINSKGRNANFSLGYVFRSSFYNDSPELNDQQHLANLSLNLTPSRKTSVSITDTFRYTQALTDHIQGLGTTSQDQPPDQAPVDTSDIGIQTKREDVISNTVALSVSRKMGQKVSAGITLSDSILEYENQALIDSRTDSASLLLSYLATRSTSFTLTYAFSNIFYDLSGTNLNSGVDTAPVAAEVDNIEEVATLQEDVNHAKNTNIGTHMAMIGITERLSPSLLFSISGGATYTPNVNDRNNKYDWTARASIAKTMQFSSIALNYSRGILHTSGLTNQINVNETVSLNWNLRMGKKINLSANGSYSRNKSEASSNIPVVSVNETTAGVEPATDTINTDSTSLIFSQLDTESYRAGIRANWSPLQWLAIFLGYTHYEQISADSLTRNITREQASIGFTATYGPNRY